MLAAALDKSLEKRFPECGTQNLHYCAANFLDLRFPGAQTKHFEKLEELGIFSMSRRRSTPTLMYLWGLQAVVAWTTVPLSSCHKR